MSETPDNPWREFVENVISGDNYFRSSEYRELLSYIDGLIVSLAAVTRERDEDQGVIAVWRGRTQRAEEERDALRAELDSAREKADYMGAVVRSIADSLKKVVLMARTSGGWQPDAELIAACEQAEDALSMPGISKAIDEGDALRAEIESLRKDAARYRWLRDLKCSSVSVSHNEDHACNYVTAAQWIDECAPQDFVDDDPEEVTRMKQTDSIWRVQIYPNTPIGFNVWHGATLDAAIDAALTPAEEPK